MTCKSSDHAAEVLRLGLVEGLSVRAIARRLGMARKTVRQILGRSLPERKPATPRAGLLDAYEKPIRSILDDVPDIRAPAMLERLRPLGYTGGITILKAKLHALRQTAPREAFLMLQFEAGSAMQVDWADFGFALPGIPRRVSAFVAALCYSRYFYVEFTLSQSFGSLVRCMDRCLRFYGGTTEVDIFDNMKTVVRSHTAAATVFNPTFLEYARHRGFAVRACNVGRGNEKGRVERPVGFLRTRFWPGRRFRDLLGRRGGPSGASFALGDVRAAEGATRSRGACPRSCLPPADETLETRRDAREHILAQRRYGHRIHARGANYLAGDDVLGIFLVHDGTGMYLNLLGGEGAEKPSILPDADELYEAPAHAAEIVVDAAAPGDRHTQAGNDEFQLFPYPHDLEHRALV